MALERTVKKLFKAHPTLEGAGVHLNRVFAQPEVPQFDPFLLLDDFGSTEPADYMKGFPWHPHRGIETVTYMIEGEVAHGDSIGNRGVIAGGDMQWMTAGSGIIHQEMPKESYPRLKGLQLWVNLPKSHKMTAPKYRGIEAGNIPVVEDNGATVRVIAGTYNDVSGPITGMIVPVRYLVIDLVPNANFLYEIPEHFTAFIYVYEGSITIGDETVIGEQFAALTNKGDAIKFRAQPNGAKCILVAGEPIGESVAWGGPIVMNTHEELEKAFDDYRSGTFIVDQSA